MRRRIRFLMYIMTFTIFMGIITSHNALAATSFNITDKVNVDVNKNWIIKFSDELDKSSIEGKDSVLVLDDKGGKVNIQVGYQDRKTLKISPVNQYKYGTNYKLIIKNTIKSNKGKKIKNDIKMRFTTKTKPIITTHIKTIEDMNVILYKGEKYTFPSVVKAVMSDNKEKSVSVKWNNTYLDTSKSGTYYYKGTVAGYDKKVNLKIVVNSSSNIDLSKIKKVCIDAASASNLKGLTGPTGVKDKDINLSIALKLGKLLENKGIKVTYTRQSDSVSWNEDEDVLKRDKIANDSESEIFISIRSNYYPSLTAEGAETYYLGTDNTSKILAEQIQKNIILNTAAKDRGAKEVSKNHIEFLQGFKRSAILVYTGFISNPNEEKLLSSSQYQDKIAQGIAEGIINPKSSAKYKICIDPGHGGYDPGTIGYSGTKEKDIALQVSLKLGQVLKKNGIDVVYTRTSDNVPWPAIKKEELKMRCDISDKAKADCFVSIHANSVDDNTTASGIETLYGSNRTDGIPLARNIQNEMVVATGGRNRGIKKRNNVFVIKWTNAPSALVELEFVSNPEKEKLLKTPQYQQKCAEAIARGIMKTLHISSN